MIERLIYTKRDVEDINKIVGLNLRAARNNSDLSMSDVMQAIWGVSKNKNRLSEIETGKKNLTLVDMLLFQELYGQSLDFMCGLSVEPEVDALAGTVNHVFKQSHSMIEMLTQDMASVLVNHVKSIAKDDTLALLDSAKQLCTVIKTELDGKLPSPQLSKALRDTSDVIRCIDKKQTRQEMAVKTQMTQCCERVDKNDGHHLMRDRRRNYQFSLPLPKPRILNERCEGVGV